jgi:hypothetical protein
MQVRFVMSQQILKDHLIDIEVAAASVIAAVAHFYFDIGWPVSALLGLSAFVFIPLLVLCRFHVKALLIRKRFKDLTKPPTR